MRIALAGNPNSGKTTVFNYLTGSRDRVGNWAGVTVEAKVAHLRRKLAKNQTIEIVDLPGTYSLDAYTKDEQHASDFIRKQDIDVIINIVDASNLERHLYLTSELQVLNIPLIVVLNKADIVKRKKTSIDLELLEEMLKCDVFFVTASRNKGLKEVIEAAIQKGAKSCNEQRKQVPKRKQKRRGKGYCH
jgi:ferrous iron transport protein B